MEVSLTGFREILMRKRNVQGFINDKQDIKIQQAKMLQGLIIYLEG